MNRKVKSLVACLLAGVLLGSLIGCGNNNKKPSQTLKNDNLYKELQEFINFPKLSSIEVSRSEAQKTLDERISKIVANQCKEVYSEIDEAAVRGDQVNVSYEVKSVEGDVTLSEETLRGMTENKADVIVGSGVLPLAYYKDGEMVTDSFENQMLGMKAGETKEITVRFPDSYANEEVKGLNVSFDVTVHSVSRLTVDEKCAAVKIDYIFQQPEDDTNEAKDFAKIFSNGSFIVDYTTEPNEALFNRIFKISDYRDLFLGMHKYERIEHTVFVPEDVDDSHAPYAGQEIKVTFVMQEAITRPEWNDEMVKSYTGGQYTTVADYEAAELESIMSSTAYSAIKAAVTFKSYPTDLVEELYIDYLRDLVGEETEQEVDELTEEELKQLVDDEEKFEGYCTSAKTVAENALKERLTQEYIMDYLDITLTDEEYTAGRDAGYQSYLLYYRSYYLYYYGVTFNSAEEMEAYYGKTNLEIRFKENKLMKVILDKVTVVD